MLTRAQSAATAKAFSSRAEEGALGPHSRRGVEPAALLSTTLISGFLGAGKTTLLQHILRNKDSLRCAIIVNDMASINIDAALLKNNHLVQTEEKLVEMQNGCICCTLREDLLLEVSKLARAGKFDHLIIESTGVSEPMQVAETFEMQADDQDNPPLKDLAAIDACVTVVDASNLMANLNSIKTLKEQQQADGDKVAEEDERNIADLLIDQIEFADVILLNKVDLVSRRAAKELSEFVRILNPSATVILCQDCKVPLSKLLKTGAFSMEKAQQAPGWLKAMKEGIQPTPETEEYGISNFVYRARQPFHPARLYALLEDIFVIQQQEEDEHDHDHEHSHHAAGGTDCADAQDGKREAAATGDEAMSEHKSGEDVSKADLAQLRKNLHSRFGQVLRSKGFVWLAGNDVMAGEWSQAGSIMRLGCGGPWFAALPREAWDVVKGEDQEILADFEGQWGDRRNELVFIGIHMETEAITAALNACLATPEDVLQDPKFESAFLPWPNEIQLEEVEGSDMEQDEAEDERDDNQTDTAMAA